MQFTEHTRKINRQPQKFAPRTQAQCRRAIGARTNHGTSQQFSDFVAPETTKFAGIIRQEGLQMDVN